MVLHRQARALHRELDLAATALGDEASEQNLARLRDIQERLALFEATQVSARADP
jgi:hypothetical protein